ncbi:hypothetical protein AVEN_155302-1 [Araneus ventricosus]|uniref:Uncharacterized protein n=1 Tax=Araneus ventricosus TaxID=182803 RepID=A0A4Y2D6H2_ARAVE|nr:hypothetical protein AVEN_155302-1 [Araneus ventricosus]
MWVICYVSKRLRNTADIKAHNLYLNHTQATPNVEYVDYEDEGTDCSSDISEVILNLNTYKPSTSNGLISLTDPKYKHLTPFVAKSSQMRLVLPSTPVVGDRCGVSDRAVAAIASSVLHDVGLITSNNSDLVVDENKLRREKLKYIVRDKKNPEWDFVHFPYDTQAMERCAKLVTEASMKVHGFQNRNGIIDHILFPMPEFDNKADFKPLPAD